VGTAHAQNWGSYGSQNPYGYGAQGQTYGRSSETFDTQEREQANGWKAQQQDMRNGYYGKVGPKNGSGGGLFGNPY
jgi:hypothetical protein